jgi:IS5 family transposase
MYEMICDFFGMLRVNPSSPSCRDSDLYGENLMAETAFSVIKRRYGSAVRLSAWYRQFREVVLTTIVYNLKQALKK